MTGPAEREGWRRVLHTGSGILGPLAARLPPEAAHFAFAGLVASAVLLEAWRLTGTGPWRWLERAAGPLFRAGEVRRVSGATTLAVGYAVTWWLFPAPIAWRAIVVAALADSVAAAAGSRLRPGAGTKTWGGSAACALTAGLALLALAIPPWLAAGTAVGVATAERVPYRAIDNVTVPLIAAGLLWWLG